MSNWVFTVSFQHFSAIS